MGNPKDFRAQLKGLIGQLPQEFQDTGKGNAEQFQQWAAAELQPGRFHRLLHRA